jgi:hypothetical protein
MCGRLGADIIKSCGTQMCARLNSRCEPINRAHARAHKLLATRKRGTSDYGKTLMTKHRCGCAAAPATFAHKSYECVQMHMCVAPTSSPVCVRLWILRFSLRANTLPQPWNGHGKGRSPVCTRTWLTSLYFALNGLERREQPCSTYVCDACACTNLPVARVHAALGSAHMVDGEMRDDLVECSEPACAQMFVVRLLPFTAQSFDGRSLLQANNSCKGTCMKHMDRW